MIAPLVLAAVHRLRPGRVPGRVAVIALALWSGLTLAPLPARAQDSQDGFEEGLFALPIPTDKAARQISVTVNPGLKRTVDLPDGPLRAARVAMLAKEEVAPDLLRQLADRRDGLAALKYLRYLTANGGSASDVAYYGSVAAAAGRVAGLAPAVAAMRRLDPATEPPERVKVYVEMLYPHAWAGNVVALDGIAMLAGEGRLFGPMSEKTRARMLEQADKIGDGRLELLMATELLRQPGARETQAETIRSYLNRAAAGSHPGVHGAAVALLASLDGTAPPPAAAEVTKP